MFKRIPFFLFCLFLFSVQTNAQVIIKLPSISASDLGVPSNPDDQPSAFYLNRHGLSKVSYVEEKGFQNKFQLQREVVSRVKINNSEGAEFGNVNIYLYEGASGSETVSKIVGTTYNLENGKVTKTKLNKKEGVRIEVVDGNRKVMKIHMPKVKPGSIVEVSYILKSNYVMSIDPWNFQSVIPTKESIYITEFPEELTYKPIVQGYFPIETPVTKIETKTKRVTNTQTANTTNAYSGNAKVVRTVDNVDLKYKVTTWKANNVPALEEEKFVSSLADYLTRVSHELESFIIPGRVMQNYSTTWQNVSKELTLNADLGQRISNANLSNIKVFSATAGKDGLHALVKNFNLVQKRMTWDKSYSIYGKKSLRKVYEDKIGSAAEINMLLVKILQNAGHSAYPIVISSRGHGKINQMFASRSKFNYLIAGVYIDQELILLDATDPLVLLNQLPARAIVDGGLLVHPTNGKFITFSPTQKRSEIYKVKAVLSEEGIIAGSTSITFKDYSAYEERKATLNLSERDLSERAENNYPNVETTDVKVNLAEGNAFNFTSTFNFTADDVTVAGNKMYFNPILFLKENSNPFKLEKRSYPVDFIVPYSESYVMQLELPEGYVLEEKVEPFIIALPDKAGKALVSITEQSGSLLISSKVSCVKPLFLPTEYDGLKKFFDELVANQNKQIVIVKRT